MMYFSFSPRILAIFLLPCLFFAFTAAAHPGRKDELGCHHDRKRGGYHCEEGPLSGQNFGNKEEAIKAYRAKVGSVPPPRARKK